LDNAPISKVICVVGPESDERAIDQFDVARKKHFSLLGKAMIDWTEYLSSRLYSLSDLYYLMASPEIPAIALNSGSSCKTLSSMDFQECNINTSVGNSHPAEKDLPPPPLLLLLTSYRQLCTTQQQCTCDFNSFSPVQ